MSAAVFEQLADGRHEARSAGTQPASEVNPIVVDAMSELGIDIADRVPQRLEPADAEWADVVVTMGCGDECPYLPDKRYVDWELADPKGLELAQVRHIRDDIVLRVRALVAELDG
jgi:arsenate reductase